LANVVELEPAERAPVQITAQVFLEIAERVLVHGVDMIDSAELFHAEAAAAGAPAGPAKQEKIPLVALFPTAAFLARQDSVIDEFLVELSWDAHQRAAALSTLPHVCPFISNIANRWQLAGK